MKNESFDYNTQQLNTENQILHPFIPNLITNMSHNFYKTKMCPYYAQVYNSYRESAIKEYNAHSHTPMMSCTSCLTFPKLKYVLISPKEHVHTDYNAVLPMESRNSRLLLIIIKLHLVYNIFLVLYNSGHCKYGERCRFAHGESELRSKIEPSPFVVKPRRHFITKNTSNFDNYSQVLMQKQNSFLSNEGSSKNCSFFNCNNMINNNTSWKNIYTPLTTSNGNNSTKCDTFFESSNAECKYPQPNSYQALHSDDNHEHCMAKSEINLYQERAFYNCPSN